jgi:DNA-binding winged helix-turn-helix (wHTH) protein
MEELPSSVRAVRSGVFEVDLRARKLRKQGIRVKLQGQPYVILVTLLAQRGEPVSREELRGKLWPEDTFIDFDHSLATAVNKLREVLGDSADNPRFIETLPRLGYRFIAPIETIGPAAPIEAPVASPELTASSPSEGPHPGPINDPGKTKTRDHARRPLVWKLSLLTILVVCGALSLWIIRPWSRPPSAIRSLAVLPLENLSHDIAQDYFSDGMTDELLTEFGADRRIAGDLAYLGDDLQGRPQTITADRAGIERRPCGGGRRAALG